MEDSRKSRNRPQKIQSMSFYKGTKAIQKRKGSISTNDVKDVKILHIQGQ